MKLTRRIRAIVMAAFCTTLLGGLFAVPNADAATPVSANARQPASPPTDQLIIKFKAEAKLADEAAVRQPARIDHLTRAAGTRLEYFRPMSGDAHVLKLPQAMQRQDAEKIAKRLARLPEVEYAEPDGIVQIGFTPSDPLWATQWHYFAANGINVDDAWDVTTGSDIVVAAPDTGVLLGHPDLADRVLPGYDFVSNLAKANDGNGRDNNPSDPGDLVTQAEINAPNSPFVGCAAQTTSSWHGTHVIGTMAANTHNNIGVAGINWQARILPVRVLGKCGGSFSDIADGIRWAAGVHVNGVPDNANPARVINLSIWGRAACGKTEQDAINAAVSRGAIVVTIAGNASADASSFSPGNCSNVITVAATDRNGDRASFSNFGQLVDISAPGVDVMSTHNNGATSPGADDYDTMNGTSMAAPHVAGVASLLLAVRPELNQDQVLQMLQYSAGSFPISSTCNTSICGPGIIDAYETVTGLYVSKGAVGGMGLPEQPYGTLAEAYNRAWDGARIKLQANSYGEPMTLAKRVTLLSVGGSTVIGQ